MICFLPNMAGSLARFVVCLDTCRSKRERRRTMPTSKRSTAVKAWAGMPSAEGSKLPATSGFPCMRLACFFSTQVVLVVYEKDLSRRWSQYLLA